MIVVVVVDLIGDVADASARQWLFYILISYVAFIPFIIVGGVYLRTVPVLEIKIMESLFIAALNATPLSSN